MSKLRKKYSKLEYLDFCVFLMEHVKSNYPSKDQYNKLRTIESYGAYKTIPKKEIFCGKYIQDL